jgi:hypothetical protein
MKRSSTDISATVGNMGNLPTLKQEGFGLFLLGYRNDAFSTWTTENVTEKCEQSLGMGCVRKHLIC